MSSSRAKNQLKARDNSAPFYRSYGISGLILGTLGGIFLLTMMGLTFFDVLGRYIFNSPIRGAGELTALLMCATIFLGLGAVSLTNDHVTVDLVTNRFPEAFRSWRLAIIGLISGAVLFLVGWRIWIYAEQIGGYGGSTISLEIPIAPLGYFCAICAFVSGIITAIMPLRHLLLNKVT